MLHNASTAPSTLATAGRYRVPEDVVIERLGEAMIAVQLGTDKILELNETAARLVELLLAGESAMDAKHSLAAEYDVDPSLVGPEVDATIAMLLTEQVLAGA